MSPVLERLLKERRLLQEMAPALPLPVPVPELVCEGGPNAQAFSVHRLVPGVSIARLERPLSDRFGASLGAFLKALHAFPVARAAALGLRVEDGPAHRRERGSMYDRVVRSVFPLVTCETRTYVEHRFETYLNEPRNFEFEPRLIHHDIDRQNVLVDAATGDMTGVIDFGDARAGHPAVDFWMALVNFEKLGISAQLPAFLEAYGARQEDLAQIRTEVEFVDFLWPLHDILHGLDIGNDEFVEEGIRDLNKGVPRDLRCP